MKFTQKVVFLNNYLYQTGNFFNKIIKMDYSKLYKQDWTPVSLSNYLYIYIYFQFMFMYHNA